MKCTLILGVLLTALAVASSSVESVTALDSALSLNPQPSVEAEPSTVIPPQGYDDTDDTGDKDIFSGDPELKAWFDQLNEVTRKNDTWSSGYYPNVATADESLENITTSDTQSFDVVTAADKKRGGPNLSGYYRIDVRLSKGSTHTGTLRNKRMFNRIYGALKDCGVAHRDPSIPGFCNEDRPECSKHCDIPNIVYDKGKLKYASDSKLKLVVKFSWFDIKHHPQVRDLGFRIVARIYELMTMQSSNCRYTNFPDSRATLMCSVANKVELAFPINGGLIQGVLNVELTWSKHTQEGSYKCEGDTEGNVDAMMWTDYRGRLANAMDWPEKQILPFVYCTDSDCFKQNLKLDEPWHENKGCDPLDWPLGCDPILTGPSNPKLNCPASIDANKPPGPPGPPKPSGPRKSKALSIISQHYVEDGHARYSWLFFTSEFGKSSACRKEQDAIGRFDAPAYLFHPRLPEGTYNLRNMHGMECDYKNDGSNAGALWCKKQYTPGERNTNFQCREEPTRSLPAESCSQGKAKIEHHRVISCEW